MTDLEQTIARSASGDATALPGIAYRTQSFKPSAGPQGLNLYPGSTLLGMDGESFRWQEATFAMLDLLLLAALLCGHAFFAQPFGTPTLPLVGLLSTGFLLQPGELVWIQTKARPFGPHTVRTLTLITIVWDAVLALTLGILIDRVDSHYYVLMLVPILLAAFRPSLVETLIVIITASAFQFYVVWHFFLLHPPLEEDEYFEAGTISLMFLLTEALVWFLVNHLRRKEIGLAENLTELTRTRVRLLEEEKLAAVGRLSAAIAHKIRNPVAMISSSLATAMRNPMAGSEREEMFDIAAKEAARLERLTNDFLACAKPRTLGCRPANVMDTPGYVASLCRAHAHSRWVEVRVEGPEELTASRDPQQVQQAVLNLAMNAVEASAPAGTVVLRATCAKDSVKIDLENGNGPISKSAVPRIFEPFFTTKVSGTGPAIAHNIACSHSGLLQLTDNTAARVRFTLTLPGSGDRGGHNESVNALWAGF